MQCYICCFMLITRFYNDFKIAFSIRQSVTSTKPKAKYKVRSAAMSLYYILQKKNT
jgi:hypothetical protein